MAKIYDIDELLPPDQPVRWRKEQWMIPGDLTVARVLQLQRAVDGLRAATDTEAVEAAYEAVAQEVLSILAIRRPTVMEQEWAFSGVELGLLAGAILAASRRPPGQKDQEDPEGNGEAEAAQT